MLHQLKERWTRMSMLQARAWSGLAVGMPGLCYIYKYIHDGPAKYDLDQAHTDFRALLNAEIKIRNAGVNEHFYRVERCTKLSQTHLAAVRQWLKPEAVPPQPNGLVHSVLRLIEARLGLRLSPSLQHVQRRRQQLLTEYCIKQGYIKSSPATWFPRAHCHGPGLARDAVQVLTCLEAAIQYHYGNGCMRQHESEKAMTALEYAAELWEAVPLHANSQHVEHETVRTDIKRVDSEHHDAIAGCGSQGTNPYNKINEELPAFYSMRVHNNQGWQCVSDGRLAEGKGHMQACQRRCDGMLIRSQISATLKDLCCSSSTPKYADWHVDVETGKPQDHTVLKLSACCRDLLPVDVMFDARRYELEKAERARLALRKAYTVRLSLLLLSLCEGKQESVASALTSLHEFLQSDEMELLIWADAQWLRRVGIKRYKVTLLIAQLLQSDRLQHAGILNDLKNAAYVSSRTGPRSWTELAHAIDSEMSARWWHRWFGRPTARPHEVRRWQQVAQLVRQRLHEGSMGLELDDLEQDFEAMRKTLKAISPTDIA